MESGRKVIFYINQERKANLTGHSLLRNSVLKHIIEVKKEEE